MKYEKEIDNLLKDLFYEKWMDDEDWKEFLTLLFSESGVTKEGFSKAIDIGVNNGYSVEYQLGLLSTLFKNKIQ